jgi:tetratricopeptide (TPR) repeat protein
MNRTTFAAALLGAALTTAHAAPADDLRLCRSVNGDAAIAGCTAYLATPALKPPQAALAHMLRAQAYIGQGKLKEALADYDAATRIEPANADAWYSHAIVAAGLSRPDIGIADLTRAIALRPEWATAYVARGAMHLARGEAQQAIADDDKALQLDPNSPDAKADRAQALQLLNKP